MKVEKNLKSKKEKYGYLLSICFLLLILIGTFGLYLYNMNLVQSLYSLERKISIIDSTIEEFSNEPTIEMFFLLQGNKKMMDTIKSRSRVTEYMKHMRNIEDFYDIDFRGFRLSGGQITTTAFIRSDEKGIAYKKLVRFLRDYRNNKNVLFHLPAINKVSGYDDMSLSVVFDLKE